MNEIIEQLLDYLRGIWRNRWYALGCAWLVCLIGWVVVFILPDQYKASARVFVDTQSILRPLLQGLAVDVNPDAQIGLVAEPCSAGRIWSKSPVTTDLDMQAKGSRGHGSLLNRLAETDQSGGREPVRENPNLYSIAFRIAIRNWPKKWFRQW